MTEVANYLPAKLLIGAGAHKELSVPSGKTLLITDKGLLATGIPERVGKLLGVESVYSDLSAEPTTGDVDRALAFARKGGYTAVAGLGGGSALDVAKAVAAIAHTKMSAAEALGQQPALKRETYFAAIPTTAGTGSEATLNAIFIDSRDGVKKAIISPACLPDAAVIDPELTVSLPASVTASTGVDALCHCVESMISIKANAVSETYSLRGISLIERSIREAVESPSNLKARENMLMASFWGGAALALAGTAAVHALAYPLGKRGVPHGTANSMLFSEVMRFNLDGCGERLMLLAKGEHEPEAVLERLCDMVKQLPIPASLEKYNIKISELPLLAAEAMEQTRLLGNNPKQMNASQAESIYATLFHPTDISRGFAPHPTKGA